MKNTALVYNFPCFNVFQHLFELRSNATSHSINHMSLYTKRLLQHIASLKDFIQLVYTKYGHYIIIVIVLTIVMYE